MHVRKALHQQTCSTQLCGPDKACHGMLCWRQG